MRPTYSRNLLRLSKQQAVGYQLSHRSQFPDHPTNGNYLPGTFVVAYH